MFSIAAIIVIWTWGITPVWTNIVITVLLAMKCFYSFGESIARNERESDRDSAIKRLTNLLSREEPQGHDSDDGDKKAGGRK